jgi:hypothetical protein
MPCASNAFSDGAGIAPLTFHCPAATLNRQRSMTADSAQLSTPAISRSPVISAKTAFAHLAAHRAHDLKRLVRVRGADADVDYASKSAASRWSRVVIRLFDVPDIAC